MTDTTQSPHTGTYLSKGPCANCGSSDARAQYTDGSYCFSCATTDRNPPHMAGLVPLSCLSFEALPNRGLSKETCKRWSYGLADGAHYATYHSPKNGAPVSQKVRRPGKRFTILGKMGPLYGQNLWRSQGRMLVVTEGEIDAMSFSQIQDHKFPVVSVPNGASAAKAAVLENLEWIEGFEEVIFMFDMDEPGGDAAVECCAVLTPGKGKIATLPLKDANEMLVAGRLKEAKDAMWNARTWRPDGILSGEDIWAAMLAPRPAGLSLPWAGLNTMLRGIHRGKILTLVAATGAGKSTACREIAVDLAMRHKQTIGYIGLEENPRETGWHLASVLMDRPMTLEENPSAAPGAREAFVSIADRVHIYDHWGGVSSSGLMPKLRYLAKGLSCGFIILDHVSIALSGMEMGAGERVALDKLMTDLRGFVEESQVGLLLVCHLSRGDKRELSHERGAPIELRDLRGSHSVAQLSDTVVAVERDQQGEDETLVIARVLKNRPAAKLGVADKLRYHYETGRLLAVEEAF